ncbi:MAG: class IV adenylate cyclase [Candidatus Paceibacterota bacterium]
MKEIEILIEVKSTKEEALNVLSHFESKGVKETLDVYFNDPLRNDLQPGENNRLLNSFRLRQKAGKNYLAYKVDHFDGEEWSHSDEYETGVADLDVMIAVIEKLGLVEMVRIDNFKHTFITPDYEIVLEDVKDLGLFMEVEKLAQVSDEEVLSAKEEIRTFLKTLNIDFGEEQNAGKPELMLRKNKK